MFPDAVIKSHKSHVKIRQTNYSFRKPNQFSLTNFCGNVVLKAITEHVHFSSNTSTFLERAIKDNRGAWSIRVSTWVFANTKTSFCAPHQQPMQQDPQLVPHKLAIALPSQAWWGSTLPGADKIWCKLKWSSSEAQIDRREHKYASASFMGHLSKMPAYQVMSLPGSWCSQWWFKVEVQSTPGVKHFWAVFTVSSWWFTGFDYPFFITTKSEIKMFQRQLLVLISAAEAGSGAVTQGRDGIPAASTATRQVSLKANTFSEDRVETGRTAASQRQFLNSSQCTHKSSQNGLIILCWFNLRKKKENKSTKTIPVLSIRKAF